MDGYTHPRRDYEQDARRKSSLEHTDKDSEDNQMVVVLGCSHSTCNAAPDEHNDRQESTGTPSGEDHVGGNFENDVCDLTSVNIVVQASFN